jgi:hypothetical protein
LAVLSNWQGNKSITPTIYSQILKFKSLTYVNIETGAMTSKIYCKKTGQDSSLRADTIRTDKWDEMKELLTLMTLPDFFVPSSYK